jgi:hypothetical protein
MTIVDHPTQPSIFGSFSFSKEKENPPFQQPTTKPGTQLLLPYGVGDVCWPSRMSDEFGSEKIILSLPLPDPQVTLENIFNCYLRNTSLFFQNYHLKLFHSNFQFLNDWKKSENLQKLRRDLTYGYSSQLSHETVAMSRRFCHEAHDISIEKNEDDQWTKLNLEIQTRIETVETEGNGNGDTEQRSETNLLFIFRWKLTFRLVNDALQLSLSSSAGPPNESITQICHIPTLIAEITEMVPLLSQLDEDVSDDWFKLISCSSQELSEEETKETTTGDSNFDIFAQNLIDQSIPREVVMSITEEINPADPTQLIESLAGEAAPQTASPTPQRQLQKHECIYFSVKLGINFRIQSNTIQIGSVETSENSSDDFSSIHCLDLTCLESIYENALTGDNVYVRALNHTIDNRPSKISLILSRERPTYRLFVPDDVTREVAAQERFWRIGQDTNQPTYYISAAPVKRTSSIATAQPATASSSSASSSSAPVPAVATTAQFTSPAACDVSDPRSPGARTPIVATVVVARPLEVSLALSLDF